MEEPTFEPHQAAILAGRLPPTPPILAGRDELLAELLAALTDESQPSFLALTGLAGSGKSAVAAALARHPAVKKQFPDGILWAGLGDQPQPAAILGRWAESLREDVRSLSDENSRSWALKRAIGRRRCLLIIDDARDLKSLFPLRCGGPNGRYLLTTRFESVAAAFAKSVIVGHLPPLTEKAAAALLTNLSPELASLDKGLVDRLAAVGRGNPLALTLLAGYLNAAAELPAAAALALSRLTAAGKTEPLPAVLTFLLDLLPAAAHFTALTALAPAPATFSAEAAAYVAQMEAGQLHQLVKCGLLSAAGAGRFSLPAALVEAAPPSPPTARSRQRSYYLAWSRQRRSLAESDLEYPQLRRAWKTAGDDRQIIDFAYALRTYQREQGFWRDYIDWHMRALKSAKAYNWQSDLGTLRNNMGVIYELLGEGRRAVEFYERALEIRAGEADPTGLATTLHHLGNIYYRSGLHNQALTAFERLLDIEQRAGDPLKQAAVLGNIGSIHDSLGQAEKALDAYQQALRLQESNGDQGGQAVTLNNIGSLYTTLEKYELAINYFQQTLPLREANEDHVGLATTLNNMGTVYSKTGRSAEALQAFQRALQIQIEMGDQHGESITRWWIALAHQAANRPAEALVELRLAAELAAANQSPHHQEIQKKLREVETGK